MKGKNKREDSRRSRRLARQAAKLTALGPQDQPQSAGNPRRAAEVTPRLDRALPPLLDSAVIQVATEASITPEELLYNCECGIDRPTPVRWSVPAGCQAEVDDGGCSQM